MPSKKKQSTEAAVREIRRRARRKFVPEEKAWIVPDQRFVTQLFMRMISRNPMRS
jgi:hypothetical protein